MNAEIERLTIFADTDAVVSVNKFTRDNIRPYTVSLDEPDLDIWLTEKQALERLSGWWETCPQSGCAVPGAAILRRSISDGHK